MGYNTFLNLVRIGIGNSTRLVNNPADWNAIEALAARQGLSAVILDALNTVDANIADSLPVQMKLKWIGNVLQNYEKRYVLYKRAMAELAGWYNSQGFKMMVLKGYACSLDWPKPEHRPCGDIDIWLFGKQKEADWALGSWFKDHGSRLVIDNSHHHHTVFEWKGFTVENHYDFVNVHHSKSNKSIEKVFKELGNNDKHYIDVNGEKVYVPSPNLHALFLLRHSMIEFAASSITLRQVLDWAFFVEKHTREIAWEWLLHVLDEYHMLDFYNCLNAICIEDLGFDLTIFPQIQFNPYQKDRVLNEILNPVIPNEKPKMLFNRVVWKINRWKTNEWKYNLCYNESMWSAFWSGVWNHMLKPASI
jgi:hypothetical protein